MKAEEIRDTFSHNQVYSTGYSGFPDEDMRQLLRLNILSTGEIAAQLAELNENMVGVRALIARLR